jgi:hypothetical protein
MGQAQQNLDVCQCTTNRGHRNLARNIINHWTIRWALGNFQPFKSAGTDEILSSLLQQGMEYLVPYLYCIFTACLAYGFIHMAWGQVQVTFIPKPRKSDYT